MMPTMERQWDPSLSFSPSSLHAGAQHLNHKHHPQITSHPWHPTGALALTKPSTSVAFAQNQQPYQQWDIGFAEIQLMQQFCSGQQPFSNQTTRCGSEVEGVDAYSFSVAASNGIPIGLSNSGSPLKQLYASAAAAHPEALYTTHYRNQEMTFCEMQQHMQHRFQQQRMQQQAASTPGLVDISKSNNQAQPKTGLQYFSNVEGVPSKPLFSTNNENKNKCSKTEAIVNLETMTEAAKGSSKPSRKRSQAACSTMEYPKGNPTAAELALVSQYEPADHIAGVRFSPNKRQWLAAWSVAPGKEVRKHFSVVQKGYGEAWRLAVLCRWEAERNGARIRLRANAEGAGNRKRISRHCSNSNSSSNSNVSSSSNAVQLCKLSPYSEGSASSGEFE